MFLDLIDLICDQRRFLALSAQLILRTACELILYDAQIIFIHCQGINLVSKVRGMTDYLK